MLTVSMIASLVCFAAAMHPFATYPLSLLAVRAWLRRRAARQAGALPYPPPVLPDRARLAASARAALCFCAYNEERVIVEKIANLRQIKARMPDLKIYCYVDGSTDRTAALIREHGGDLVELVEEAARRGKSYGMNRLVAKTDADFLLFTDANVFMNPDTVARVFDYFADPGIGCVAGRLIYINGGETLTASNGALFWRLEEYTKRLESETGSIMGVDGSFFAIRRSLHRSVPEDIIDDMYLSFSILLEGRRVVSAPEILSYERGATVPEDEFRRKIRIACQAFNVHRLLWPGLRRMPPLNLYKYLSHRVARWFCTFMLGISGVFAAGFLAAWLGPMVAAKLLLGLWILVALGFIAGIKPVCQAIDIVVTLLGVSIGVIQSLRGSRYATWNPAASVRASPR